jgi:hypothetical protein
VQPASPGRPPGRPDPLLTTSHDDDQVQSRPSAGPARPAPASNARLQPRADDAPSWTRRATRPTPGHPSHAAAGLHQPATSLPLDTADAATHGHRTLEAGQWTPGRSDARTGTGHWTGPVDHRTLASDTGHQMPDTNADTVTTAQLVSGPPWPPRERPHAETPNRACALALPAGCSAARPAKRRLGALLSSDDFGSSVERRGGCHPVHAGREDAYGVRCSVCWVERVAAAAADASS